MISQHESPIESTPALDRASEPSPTRRPALPSRWAVQIPAALVALTGLPDRLKVLWDSLFFAWRAGPRATRSSTCACIAYMDCGRDDLLLSEFRKMEAELKARGADFKAQIVTGDHDWTFLTRHYADSPRFCDERFREMAKQE